MPARLENDEALLFMFVGVYCYEWDIRVDDDEQGLPCPLLSDFFDRPPRAAAVGLAPSAAALIVAMRCLALSSPWSAALTYHTLASRGSRWQPMPISVK